MRFVGTLTCTLALSMATVLAAGPSRRTQWVLREFTWIKLVPKEKDAPANAQPVEADREALGRALGGVKFVNAEGAEEDLFAREELAPLLGPLTEALALAGTEEDVVLLSSHRRGGMFLATPYGVTARIFAQGGGLNLIVHDTRNDFVDRYRAGYGVPVFAYGSRTEPGKAVLRSAGPRSPRPDWLVLPLDAPDVTTRPLVTFRPDASAAPRDPAPPESQSERLRTLKRLREDNLITEEEYRKKRQEILDRL